MSKNRPFDEFKHILNRVEAVAELLILTIGYYFIWNYFYRGYFPYYYLGRGKYILGGVYFFILLILFILTDCMKFGYLRLSEILISQWISLALCNFVTYFQLCLIATKMISPLWMIILTLLDFLLAFVFSFSYTAIYHSYLFPRNMLMVCGTDDDYGLAKKMSSRSDKYRITKTINSNMGITEIEQEILNNHDAVILNGLPFEMHSLLITFCYKNSVRTYVVPKISDIMTRGADEISLFDTPLFRIKGTGLTLYQRFFKRLFDVLLSGIAVVILSPILLLVALAIKFEDHGPIFYKQKRVTRNGEVFEILKFRSMIVDAEKNGQVIPATDRDPRITKVGRFIRACRVDELPQLLNILKGDMSIVGPRPERVEHVEKYSKEIPEFHFREKVKGGLTGYAQIVGKYNTSPYDKLCLDLMYIEKYSFLLDIKIIFMTLRVLFQKESTEGFDKK